MSIEEQSARTAVSPTHLGFLLAINLMWGYNLIAAKQGVESFPPVFFCFLRFLVLAVVLAPFLRVRKGQMGWLLAAGLMSGGLQFAIMFIGVAMLPSMSAAAIASQLGVPFATLLSVLLLGERVRWRRWLGIALSFAGVVLIGFNPRVLDSAAGLGFVVLAAFVGSLGLIAIKRIQGVPPLELQAWFSLISLPVLLPLSLVVEHGQWHSIATASSTGWIALAYTTVASSLIAHTGFFWLLQRYPVTSVAPLTVLAPIFGVAFSVLLLGDRLDWRMVVGGAMTLIGVVIIMSRERALVDTGT